MLAGCFLLLLIHVQIHGSMPYPPYRSLSVFHAGTSHNADGELVTAGGRVLNVVALGKTFEEARERAYAACDLISFEGKQFRTDIGAKAARGRSAWE